MRVFLDANVLFSASNPESIMGRLIKQAALRLTLMTNTFVETEARRNLTLKRPQWISEFEQILEKTEQVADTMFDLPVSLNQKDQPVLCSAIRSNCKYLVTGDKRDFGPLYDQTVEGVIIISPVQFAQILKDIPRKN